MIPTQTRFRCARLQVKYNVSIELFEGHDFELSVSCTDEQLLYCPKLVHSIYDDPTRMVAKNPIFMQAGRWLLQGKVISTNQYTTKYQFEFLVGASQKIQKSLRNVSTNTSQLPNISGKNRNDSKPLMVSDGAVQTPMDKEISKVRDDAPSTIPGKSRKDSKPLVLIDTMKKTQKDSTAMNAPQFLNASTQFSTPSAVYTHPRKTPKKPF